MTPAMVQARFADGGVPTWTESAVPVPGPGQVLVEVRASGLNRADILQRDADYPPPPGESDVPGLECSGRITAIGPGVQGWRVGQHVCALLGSGGHATHALVPADLLIEMPDGWSFIEAAALPEALATVWLNLRALARVQAGDQVLVHAANSGVGTLAAQVAAALGAQVVGTVRSSGMAAAVLELGAHDVVDSSSPDALERLHAASADGFDITLDLVGAAVSHLTIPTLAPGGRWLVIGVLGGSHVRLDLRTVIRRRLQISGASLRSLPLAQKAGLVRSLREDALPLLHDRVRPLIAEVYPAEDITSALARLEAGGVLGKIVLRQADAEVTE